MLKNSPFRILYKNKSLKCLSTQADEELVKRYSKDTNPEIVTILLSRYSDYITGMSINYLKSEHDTQDFVQELYLKMIQKLKYTEVKNFRSWLLTTVKNLLIDTGRRDHTRLMHIENFHAENSGLTLEYEEEDQPDIEEIINSFDILNENEKKCIEELYLNEKTYSDAMKDNKWSYNEVRGYRDRAIRKLRKTHQQNQRHS